MVAGIVHAMNKCNDNCEVEYWNDQSIDFTGIQQHGLHWDYATECEGWAKTSVVRLDNENEYVSIPGIKMMSEMPGHHPVSCIVPSGTWGNDELRWQPLMKIRIVGREIECPPARYPDGYRYLGSDLTEAAHDGIRCYDATDYRIVDLYHWIQGDQTPYVAVVRREIDDQLFIELGDGTPLYLDGLPWWMYEYDWWLSDGWKIWAYGDRNKDRLNVLDYDYLSYVGADD